MLDESMGFFWQRVGKLLFVWQKAGELFCWQRARELFFFADGGRIVSSAEGGRIGFGKGWENRLSTAGNCVVPPTVVVQNFPLVINEMKEELDFVIFLIPVQLDLEFVFWVALVRVPCAFYFQTVLVLPFVERVT